MTETETPIQRAAIEPLPNNIPSAQPGGGVCYRIELAWGRLRRWYLRGFRPGYIRRMADLRQGTADDCPHEVLDPRDLKYFRARISCHWRPEDDPFRWRERLPWARWGLAELQIFLYPLAVVTIWAAWHHWLWAMPTAIMSGFILYFFRDPPRSVPPEAGAVVSPADGTVAEVGRVEDDPYLGGAAIRIGIFLSVFNVHLNRAPRRARVVWLRYEPGKFLNALRPASTRENECMWVGLEEESPPHRRMIVRQIAGAVARRIVCDLRPGEVLERGQKWGMIKLGSRTELYLPAEEGLEVLIQPGQKVKAGSTIVAKFRQDEKPT